MSTSFDLADLKRRMAGAVQAVHKDLASLRTGRASANLLDPIQVDAYGSLMPLN
jgi:ribosome recycling factor